jgi:uncharacterized Ntn-hydrolase superfamily protein
MRKLIVLALWALPLPAHATYSIVARDAKTGEIGVAVQSHFFNVGGTVPWAEAGVGAVATQAFANLDYGPKGLALLRAGKPADQVLAALLAEDPDREQRQVAIIDGQGHVAVHTGKQAIQPAGSQLGDGFSAQANMMASADVWPAMAKAYESTSGPLAERLLAALDAAQAKGGDYRGKQSAAILIVSGKRSDTPWREVVLNLRVDDNAEPLVELRRLYRKSQTYRRVFLGVGMLKQGDKAGALAAAREVWTMPEVNDEIRLAGTMLEASAGDVDHAAQHAREVLARSPELRKNVLYFPMSRFPGLPALRKKLGIPEPK